MLSFSHERELESHPGLGGALRSVGSRSCPKSRIVSRNECRNGAERETWAGRLRVRLSCSFSRHSPVFQGASSRCVDVAWHTVSWAGRRQPPERDQARQPRVELGVDRFVRQYAPCLCRRVAAVSGRGRQRECAPYCPSCSPYSRTLQNALPCAARRCLRSQPSASFVDRQLQELEECGWSASSEDFAQKEDRRPRPQRGAERAIQADRGRSVRDQAAPRTSASRTTRSVGCGCAVWDCTVACFGDREPEDLDTHLSADTVSTRAA